MPRNPNVIGELIDPISEDSWIDMLCGTMVGSGQSRATFLCRANANYVVKVEKCGGAFNNVREWDIWKFSENSEILAPCEWISDDGRILLQQRTYAVLMKELPRRVPKWLTDLKRSNWGRLDNGEVVCHDYANNYLVELRDKTLVKPNWKDY